MKNLLRAATRLLRLSATVVACLPSGILCRTATRRAAWNQRLSRHALHIMGGTVRVCGTPPTGGLLVCNHLGYLDVLAISSIRPAVFVAKSDVRNWPVIGILCRIAGTIFVERSRRTSAADSIPEIASRLRNGQIVVLFPEGTSTDGSTVLPFKTSLLSVAKDHPCTTAAISYELPSGSATEELCYWRDMVFGPHFWKVLTRPGFTIHLQFGEQRSSFLDRKLAGTRMRADIQEMLQPISIPPVHCREQIPAR